MKIKLEDILPNPHRDLELHPLDPEKVAELRKSIEMSGWWHDTPVRPSPTLRGKYELHYGHHRLAALRELHKPFYADEFVVEKITDEEMLLRMGFENSEHWRSDFLATLEPIRALLKSSARGEVAGFEYSKRKAQRRYKLSELLGDQVPISDGEKHISPRAVGKFFGWTVPHKRDGEQAQEKVRTALKVLKMMAEGLIEPEAFRGISNKKAEHVYAAALRARFIVNGTIGKLESEVRWVDHVADLRPEVKDQARKARVAASRELASKRKKAKDQIRQVGRSAGAGIRQGRDPYRVRREAYERLDTYDPFDPNWQPDIEKVARTMRDALDRYLTEDASGELHAKLRELAPCAAALSKPVRVSLTRALHQLAERCEYFAKQIEEAKPLDVEQKPKPKAEPPKQIEL